MITCADPTLSEFFESVYMHKPSMVGGSPATHDDYRVQLRHFGRSFRAHLERLGQPPREPRISDLSEDRIEAAMAERIAAGVTPATANKIGRVLYAQWKHAHRKRYVESLPRPEFFREPERIPEAWSIDEFRLIVATSRRTDGWVGSVLASAWWPALLLTIWNTGARISAVMAIRTEWVDFEGGYVSIYFHVQKDRADLVVELQDETVEALTAIEPDPDGLLFGEWPYDRGDHSWRALGRRYRKILRAAGLPYDRREDLFHKIRKTFATCVASSHGLVVAQEKCGHSSATVTRRYVDPRQTKRPSVRDMLPSVAERPRLFVAGLVGGR